MLSTRYLPQPYPSYPALCRQDTTCAWSTDYGGNHLRITRKSGTDALWALAVSLWAPSLLSLYVAGLALVVQVLRVVAAAVVVVVVMAAVVAVRVRVYRVDRALVMAVCHTLCLGEHYTTHPRSQVIATASTPERLTYQTMNG